jgi:potassium inwardly-rectifying channel subfamily J
MRLFYHNTKSMHFTKEGELYEEMQVLKVQPDTNAEPCVFFVWPLDIVHVIDADSPLYDLSASQLAKEKFEIIVLMEGCTETTSMNFQARTSYLPSEILWGHRFEPMMLYRKDNNKFQVNFSAFHSTYEVETPTCSARELEILHQQQQQQQQQQQHKMAPKFSITVISLKLSTMQVMEIYYLIFLNVFLW